MQNIYALHLEMKLHELLTYAQRRELDPDTEILVGDGDMDPKPAAIVTAEDFDDDDPQKPAAPFLLLEPEAD